ncbi:MAG: hypothetical protein CBE43_00190 [Rhodopirellula sp. TMED283]|nr:MAG: hypothetical protein CBE43_00190 [Rhodopirellula sp. TMED283]
MKPEMAKELSTLEKENARLKKMFTEQALDIETLQEAAKGNWQALNVVGAQSLPCVAVWGQKKFRSVVPAEFWVNHATPSDINRVERTMSGAYCPRCVSWLVKVLALDRDAFIDS